MLPTTQFTCRKVLGICDVLLCVSHTLQSALERGRRLGLCRLNSVWLLTRSIIRESSSCSLWELEVLYTLSCCIGKVVASHAEGCRVYFRQSLLRFVLCTRHSGGAAHKGGGCDQSIGSTIYGAFVHSWLWSTATRNCPLGNFSCTTASSW